MNDLGLTTMQTTNCTLKLVTEFEKACKYAVVVQWRRWEIPSLIQYWNVLVKRKELKQLPLVTSGGITKHIASNKAQITESLGIKYRLGHSVRVYDKPLERKTGERARQN